MTTMRQSQSVHTLGVPVYTCGEHVTRGYRMGRTVDSLVAMVTIEPCIAHPCGIKTRTGNCPLPAAWKFEYWRVRNKTVEFVIEPVQEGLFI